MRRLPFALLFATAAAVISGPASADDRLQSSFTNLIARGFQIKSVTLIPLEVAKRVTEKVRTDNVVVTLQKEETVGVCYVAFANWAFMNKASLDSPTLCEVRSSLAAAEAATPPTPPTPTAEAPPATEPTPTSPSPEPAPEATPSTPPASGTNQ